jgi:hypothetical protein
MIKKLIFKILLYFSGGEDMMALLLAQRIILGKLEFEQVPSTLKPQVYEILDESGVAFLAGDYEPPIGD